MTPRLVRVVISGALGVAWPAAAWAFGGSGARVWLPESYSTYAPAIDQLFYVVLGLTGGVFFLVQGTLLVFLLRYRRRPGVSAHYTHGNNTVEIVWTVVPALILVGLLINSQTVWSHVRGTPPPHDLELEVQGEQFAWNIRYAGPDGRLHTDDDITTINQMQLPVQQTALVHLASTDVIHSFFIPQFRVKQDAVPGLRGRLWVTPTREGQLEIVCAELCGLGHYRMRGFLTIASPEAFQAWLAEQTQGGT